jgi:hypothetical protein
VIQFRNPSIAHKNKNPELADFNPELIDFSLELACQHVAGRQRKKIE